MSQVNSINITGGTTTTTTLGGNTTPTVGWSTINLPKGLSGSSLGTGAASGTVLMGSATGTNAWSSISVDTDMIDFCEMILMALGVDITYDDFCKMSKQERKSLLRDIKIKRLLD